MNIRKKTGLADVCKIVLCCIAVMIVMSSTAYADALEDIRFLKIDAKDHTAVIKTPAGKMSLVRVDDVINSDHGKEFRVKEITDGRVVIERKTDMGPETVIIRFENGKQTVERISRVGEKQPMLLLPYTKK